MGLTRSTALTIATNYPKDILIESSQTTVDNKYNGCIYLLREGDIHRLLIDTKYVFDSADEAKEDMKSICEGCVNWYNEEKEEKS